MKLRRRSFLQLLTGVAALSAVAGVAFALDYPTRPVQMIVDIPAGLAPDVGARLIGPPLSARLGQSVIIENKPGAGGNVGAEIVVRAPPDGYTLLMMISGNAASGALHPHLTFNFVRDIAAVAFVGYTPFAMTVPVSFPAKTVPEFIAYAKSHPGTINFASGGVGTAPHLAGELFKQMAGVDLVHVPYTSSYMPDLLAGRVQVTFAPIATSLANVKAGKLRALAVTGTTRSDILPDVPPVAEFVKGYEASVWHGVGAPKGTAADIVNKLSRDIGAVIADPAVKAQLAGLGAEPMPMTPGEFGKFIAEEVKKWANVVKLAGLKPV